MKIELKTLVVNYGTFYFHHCLSLFLPLWVCLVGLFKWLLAVWFALFKFQIDSKLFLVFLENTWVFTWEERCNFL